MLSVSIVFSFLVGCGGGGGGKSGGAGATGSIPQQPLATITVDHNGGKVIVSDPTSSLNGASVDIPAGALTQPTTITINSTQSTSPIVGALPIDFGPDGTTFAMPVTITVPYSDTLIQTYDDDPQDLLVFSRRPSGEFDVDTVQSIDQTQRRVTATTTHFSLKEAKFSRHYILFKQPRTLFDSSPVPYKITTRHILTPGGMQTLNYYPVIVYDAIPATIPLGKGSFTSFWSKGQRNVIIIHGLQSSPPAFLFSDDPVKVYKDGLLWTLRNNSAFDLYDNIILYQYPSGVRVAENGKWLADTVKKNAQVGFKTDIIAHSMGGIVARSAIEQFGLSPYIERLITLGSPHEGGQLNYFTAYLVDKKIIPATVKNRFPGLADILGVGGSGFLDDPQTGLNITFNKMTLATGYYLVAAKKDPTSGDDGLVTVGSATSTYLQVQLNHQAIFDDVEHSELHTKARTNGVLMKIREWVTGRSNATPTANAGVDQIITIGPQVTLDGSQSADPDLDTITYAWTQTAGQNVTLTNNTTATATFTPTQTGDYTFQLTVSDSLATGTDTIIITVVPGNGTPIANAGPDQTRAIGMTVTLDGSRSTDPDNDPLTNQWTQTAGVSVVLSNTMVIFPTFIPQSADTYIFSLVVHDGKVASAADTVTITVPAIQQITLTPSFDTDYATDPNWRIVFNRDTAPSLAVGTGGSTMFWSVIRFDTTNIPQGATIVLATLELVTRMVWTHGTVYVRHGTAVVGTFTTQNSKGDVTAGVQAAVTAGQQCELRVESSSAYLEYFSSENGATTRTRPSLTIEWQ